MSAALASCDCCRAPMVKAAHYRADACSAGCDTDACVLCSSQVAPDVFAPESDALEEEILALAQFATDPGVSGRLVALAMELEAAYERDERRRAVQGARA